jgi:hypothetical protein
MDTKENLLKLFSIKLTKNIDPNFTLLLSQYLTILLDKYELNP